ncbi:MAG: hypothetical protein ACXABY_13350 [Candidatus Thorarchaeota archaeon]|jgi:hypothetical protein
MTTYTRINIDTDTPTLPSQGKLLKWFDIDFDKGTMTWAYRTAEDFAVIEGITQAYRAECFNEKRGGKNAGGNDYKKECVVTVSGVKYRKIDLMYKAATGKDPVHPLIHGNGDMRDDRLSNIRELIFQDPAIVPPTQEQIDKAKASFNEGNRQASLQCG